MNVSNPLAKRGKTRADEPQKPASQEPTKAARRSFGDLAKMDMSELLGAVRFPRLGSGQSRPPRSTRGSGRPLVGLDIEPGFVTAAQVSVNGGIAVEKAAAVEIAPEVVRDGEVVDVAALSAALKTLFSQNNLEPRVRLGIANQRIVVRTLELPPIEDPHELETAVRFQAQNELPMSLDSAVIDFQPLGIAETASGPRQRVVLVAARREMIERLIAAAREAGLRPEGIDLSAFALIRALYAQGAPQDERVVYLSLGGLGNLAVAEGNVCQFTRVLSIGLESIAGEVAERLGVSVSDARAMLMRAGLDNSQPQLADGGHQAYDAGITDTGASTAYDAAARADQDSADFSGDDEDGAPVGSGDVTEAVRGLLIEGVRRIGVEVRNSLHYHAIHGGDHGVTRVVVSGAMTQIPGLVAAVANELELDVQPAIVHEARPGAFGGVPGERLAIAAGLAVGEVPA